MLQSIYIGKCFLFWYEIQSNTLLPLNVHMKKAKTNALIYISVYFMIRVEFVEIKPISSKIEIFETYAI